MADTLRIMCPNLSCRLVLAIPTMARGKTVRCRSCGTNIKVPASPASGANAAPNGNGNAGGGATGAKS